MRFRVGGIFFPWSLAEAWIKFHPQHIFHSCSISCSCFREEKKTLVAPPRVSFFLGMGVFTNQQRGIRKEQKRFQLSICCCRLVFLHSSSLTSNVFEKYVVLSKVSTKTRDLLYNNRRAAKLMSFVNILNIKSSAQQVCAAEKPNL